MEYKPKVVLCRLHMAGKSIQQIREECAGQGMTYRDFENIQRANEYKEEIPDHVGVYIVRDGFARNIKRASRRPAQDPDTLKASMIRSLCREVTKQIQSGDPLRVENLNRRISQLERDRDKYRRQYWDLLREVEERFGTRWRKGG